MDYLNNILINKKNIINLKKPKFLSELQDLPVFMHIKNKNFQEGMIWKVYDIH